MTTTSGGYPNTRKKENPSGKISNKADIANSPDKARHHVASRAPAVEFRETEYIPGTNAPHVA